MEINISNLKQQQQLKCELNEKSFVYDNETILFSKPIVLDCSLQLKDGIVSLDGTIDTELELTCFRCLEKFKYRLQLELHEKFTNNIDNEDESIIFIDSDKIDITDVVKNNIIMALPLNRLCKENCKGLCQVCGTNLNLSKCTCEVVDIDPRLAKLQDLFSGK